MTQDIAVLVNRGPRRYDVAAVLELTRLRPRPYTLTLDGVSHRLDGVLVAVGNCPSYGGGMRICPDADPADGCSTWWRASG